jgi:membrane fusion protein (multidrug efflux system)
MDDVTRNHDMPSPPATDAPPAPRRSGARRAIMLVLGLIIVAGLLTVGTYKWLQNSHFESTDDAMIDANTVQVAPRIAGQVTQILFRDNQHVTAGEVLVRIDPRDYQAKLDQAKAQEAAAAASLKQAQGQVIVMRAAVDQDNANVLVDEANLIQARQDYDRYQKINPNAVTRQQIEAATATFHAAQAKRDATRQTVEGAKAQVETAKAQVASAEAQLAQARATVQQAELQLSYCTIPAAVDGIATHRTVDVGNYVNPGQAMFALVQDGRWVTANFKETQLAEMKPGQSVDIQVDAIPGITFHAKVDSFQAGTGTAFSVLPAENATGNYVKIVQRLPVKIIFDDNRVNDHPLAPGMSVIPWVRVR